MVHYWVDEGVGKQACGGAGIQTKLKLKIMPSVLQIVKQEVDKKSAHQVYKAKTVEKTDGNKAVAKPRNLKQVQSLKERVKNEQRLTKDSIILPPHDRRKYETYFTKCVFWLISPLNAHIFLLNKTLH